ncbi:4'-phosphopantetheinyl transferase family protein [Glutamicibacter arilaitensis]|uniref:4'-phosphopantetheinyl transferase family protein n=1 Tax=Glutamicibacter arilaitensis TaxID=256701 RepID=UPI00384D9EB2
MGIQNSQSQIFYALATAREIELATEYLGGPKEILGSEARRATDFLHAEDREAFIGARTLLRLLLAYVQHGDLKMAAQLQVTRHCTSCGSVEHGKPETAEHSVSLSRTRKLFIAAVGPKKIDLGIDIERGPGFSPEGVFAGFDEVALTAEERKLVLRQADADRVRLIAWSAKEALLKASGTGLRQEPSAVPVLSSRALRAERQGHWTELKHQTQYHLRWLPVPATHVSALAASAALPVLDLSAELFGKDLRQRLSP